LPCAEGLAAQGFVELKNKIMYGYTYTTTDCKTYMVIFGNKSTADVHTFEIRINNYILVEPPYTFKN